MSSSDISVRSSTLLLATFGSSDERIRAFPDWLKSFDLGVMPDPSELILLPLIDSMIRLGELRDPDPSADRLKRQCIRGVARRAWASNQIVVSALAKVLAAVERSNIQAFVVPGALTSAAAMHPRLIEIDGLVLLVARGDFARMVSFLFEAGVQTAAGIGAAPADDDNGFRGQIDGVEVEVVWWCPGLDRDAMPNEGSTLSLGKLQFQTLPFEARVATNLIYASRSNSSARLVLCVLDLVATLSSELGVAWDRSALDRVAQRVYEAGELAELTGVIDRLSFLKLGEFGPWFLALQEALVAYGIRVSPPEPKLSRRSRTKIVVLEYRGVCQSEGRTMSPRGLYRFAASRWMAADRRQMVLQFVRKVLL